MTANDVSFEVAGAGSWLCPATGTVLVEVVGGGGGGAGGSPGGIGGAGGGGAAYAGKEVAVVAGNTYPYVVGAGGAGGTYANGSGGAGGDSSFNTSAVIADGGLGAVTNTGGAGGTIAGSTGDQKYAGQKGLATATGTGGKGGSSAEPVNGPGGLGGSGTPTAAGNPGTAGGGGGGGRFSTGGAGGAGGPGRVQLTYVTGSEELGRFQVIYSHVGVATWKAPGDGTIIVEAVGGGAGGEGGTALGFGGGGGGGGAYSSAEVEVNEGAEFAIGIGAGGTGGAFGGGNGTAGGTSSFGSLVVALGGGGGGVSGNATGGAGGQASGGTGDTKTNGSGGGGTTTSAGAAGGAGGAPLGGAGGAAVTASPNVGKPGVAPGGGGSGGRASTGGIGGAGAGGQVRLTFFRQYGTAVDALGAPRAVVKASRIVSGAAVPILPYRVAAGGIQRSTILLKADTSVYEKTPPAYIPVGHESKYNAQTGAFNFNVGNSTRIADSLAAAATGLADWFWFGDSVGEGWTELSGFWATPTVTVDWLHSMPLMMRDRLCELLSVPVAGTGMVRARSLASYADERWTGTTSWSGPKHSIYASNAQGTFQSAGVPGTKVRVYGTDRAVMRVTVDGTIVGTMGGGFTEAPIVAEFTVANAAHSVNVRANTSGQIGLRAAEVRRTTGLSIHNLSQGGSQILGTAQDSWAAYAGSADYEHMLPIYEKPAMMLGAGRHPDVILWELGGNDMQASTPNFTTLMSTLAGAMARFPNSDHILIMIAEGPPAKWPNADFPAFHEAMMQLAIDEDVPLVDMLQIIGSFDAANAAGFIGDEYGHPSTAGHAFIGRSIAQAILGAI